MNSFATTRLELLSKDNYETWTMQMKAVLVKSGLWKYVDGSIEQPDVDNDIEDENKIAKRDLWRDNDEKAKADIVLSISASELKQVKHCATAREMWLKLKQIYQSTGPARKATLMKLLIVNKMCEGDNVRDHVRKFFDIVDKLRDLEIEINNDLLSVMLLNTLPACYENFRCAIESRDELPEPEVLKIKIFEETDARRSDATEKVPGAYVVNHKFPKVKGKSNKFNKNSNNNNSNAIRCYRCHRIGHKASECFQKRSSNTFKNENNHSMLTVINSDFSDANLIKHDKLWCLDSGCTSHLCNDENIFSYVTDSKYKNLNLANGDSTIIKAVGNVNILINEKNVKKNIELKDVLHVPSLKTNLLSVGKITDNNYEVIFKKSCAFIKDIHGKTIFTAKRIGNLYYVSNNSEISCAIDNECNDKALKEWHRKLGHLNIKDLCSLSRNKKAIGIPLFHKIQNFECDSCLLGKMSRLPYTKSTGNRTTKMLEIVHTDLCGPMRVESLGKSKYFVTFIDDYSRWCEIYFINKKSDVLQKFKEYKSLVENQTNLKIKCLQSDNGTEFVNTEFNNFLKENGIRRRLTVPYSPEQNGVAERKNRTIIEMTRCLLIQANLPSTFWAEIALTSNYIRNRCPTEHLDGKTPYEVWYKKLPDLRHLREIGSEVYVVDKAPGKSKLDHRCEKGILVGYSNETKGYRIYLPLKRIVTVARDVRFVAVKESNFSSFDFQDFRPNNTDEFQLTDYHILSDTTSIEKNKVIDGNDIQIKPEISENNDNVDGENVISEELNSRRGPGRPKIIRTGNRGRPKKQYNMIESADISDETNYLENNFEYSFNAEVSMREAIKDLKWHQAIAEELKSIIKRDTLKFIERPENKNVIGSRFVLRYKHNGAGEIERRKARLVAKGFAQRPGFDFNETFAPVARIGSIRLIISLAVQYNMAIRQLDITTAFLNGELEEDVFMEPPPMLNIGLEFIIANEPKDSNIYFKARNMLKEYQHGNRVCHLQKALYGLRQSGRQWHVKLNKELKEFGAIQSEYDKCIYYIGQGKDIMIIAVYVDDIIVACNNTELIDEFIKFLKKKFELRDLGNLEFCLGLQFFHEGDGISICQSNYIKELLRRFNMNDANPSSSPMVPGTRLQQSKKCDDQPYQDLIGALMFIAICTRPDIAYAVSHLGQFNNCHGPEHWMAAKRVLRYLKGTLNHGLLFKKSSDKLVGFVDADWGGCPVDRRSYTGFVFTLGGTPVTWESHKQKTVALSSTEAEYISLTEAAKEMVYLKRFICELGFKYMTDGIIFNDNNSAQKLAANPIFHARTKHIDIRYNYIREVVEAGLVVVKYLNTKEMPADLLTKSLPGPRCLALSKRLNVREVSALREGVKNH